jgi:hypothetical protein
MTRASARMSGAPLAAPSDGALVERRRKRGVRRGERRLWMEDIGMIVVQHVESLPCLRMLFCVSKGFNFYCRNRFIALNRDMEATVRDDVQYMLKNDSTSDHAMESTFVWQLLQVISMREKVLRANRKVRLDVNSIFEAARSSRVELQQKIESSQQRLQTLRDELAQRRVGKSKNSVAADMLRNATIVADQFKDDTLILSQENAKALRAMNARLKALLRKSSRCLRKNLKEIEKVSRKCWNLALILGSPAWIADLKAAMQRINAALADRLRMGSRTRTRFELVQSEEELCKVVVRFENEEQGSS